ncbi:hypothetical protein PQ469_03275 [Mucilaginibacter sp. KACC 22773]|uniref:hypothetical protein n=1 Tax=Mucilaginibacter sp. KACC 22773 TaxID=3025671 RepID=UPI002365566A|nr:hypothetical protein [Mucilaginibacter sp. KACC 22773]WDF79027.1 hypothetical protein PQ469_03275 [Mucilaginibacter sp. KACC 22773]
MNDLLKLAISAHGGMDRWNQIKSVNVQASITGGVWYVKGRPDVLKNISVYAETQNEKLIMDFPGQNKKTIFEPKLISIAESDGSVLESWENPISSFAGHTRETAWEDVHVAYFSGEALWTYLTIPFLYAYPGFVTEEIEPWQESGETWRRLKVTFPDYISSHSREQISFFGPDGLLRRHDYKVDILGGATGANYAADYRDINGIIVPATRRVYAYQGDHIVVKEPLLVAIDMGETNFNDK